jgi:hypothetical protein
MRIGGRHLNQSTTAGAHSPASTSASCRSSPAAAATAPTNRPNWRRSAASCGVAAACRTPSWRASAPTAVLTFAALQGRLLRCDRRASGPVAPVALLIFDLLHLDGRDLCGPLRSCLQQVLHWLASASISRRTRRFATGSQQIPYDSRFEGSIRHLVQFRSRGNCFRALVAFLHLMSSGRFRAFTPRISRVPYLLRRNATPSRCAMQWRARPPDTETEALK